MTPQARRYDDLAANLAALSSPVRLAILSALREPKAVAAVRVEADQTREGERPDRPLARQTVQHHVDKLVEIGLVSRVDDCYVLDHARVFALVDEMRALSKLRAVIPDANDARTIARPADDITPAAAPPCLHLAYGRDEGVAFPLAGPAGARWKIGRSRECEVALDHDPYASAENTLIERTAEGYAVRDLESRNGTWLNWRAVPAQRSVPLPPGALLQVGRSILVLQTK